MIKNYLLTIILLLSIACSALLSQDSIQLKNLTKYSYEFDIKDGQFIGEGANLLLDAIANSHLLMLANNSRNQMESILDHALFDILNQNKYNTIIMETGPVAAELINSFTDGNTDPIKQIKSLNQKYHFKAGQLDLMPIPDLKYLGTCQLYSKVRAENWSFGGVGVESWTSYIMILDHLYDTAPKKIQQKTKQEFTASRNLLEELYSKMKGQTNDDLLVLINGIKQSDEFSSFLTSMNTTTQRNETIRSLKFSIDYWEMYGNRDFYQKNKLNYKRNKSILKEQLTNTNFNFDEDKLFLKMWRGHLSKGTTSNGFYGVGNMLMELMEYHEKSSLCIKVLPRFHLSELKLTDVLQEQNYFSKATKDIISLGKEEKWILLDLRSFNKDFYWGNYSLTKDFLDLYRGYDLIIIPKTDKKAKINY